ncbi:HAMP domain-containing sensor histidine kinase [Herbaspirillum sp. YR522]|uniref:sensor histidine kinase n=1 Tax=Herbaspirillum sp. YR522 TaxID=1144342 RepID=UPI00026F6530|nr:ATP-binding protein [Herbaspirillum sp. YR522]EJN03574.1 signal transduction histidine kinase [Herbaspirillum sp. YR522]
MSLAPLPPQTARPVALGATASPRARRPYNLSLRLLGVTALLLTLATTAVVGGVAALQRWLPERIVEHKLESSAERVMQGLQYDPAGQPYKLDVNERIEACYRVLIQDCVYRVLDLQGRVLLASDGGTSAFARPGSAFDPAAVRLSLSNNDIAAEVLTRRIEHDGRAMFLQVMRSDRLHRITLDDGTERMRRLTLVTVVVCMLLFSIVVVASLHYLLKPLRRAALATASIDPDNLSARLSVANLPRELTPLFEGFNQALDRLEQGYRQQREFLADVAHELKTPLALMRGQVELGELGQPGMLLKDIDQMARHVHQLLHLAEASEQHNYLIEALDPADVLAQVCQQLTRLARSREVRIVFIASDEANRELINADAGALSVLVKNLLENAIHHSPRGGAVSVHADRFSLSVRDQGPGVDRHAMPHLFKRFWRGANRRDEGAGLGLSICAEIARTHGWTLHVANTHPGAQFEVRFGSAALG